MTLYEDLRPGLRMMRKSPGFCAAAVLTVALAVGACSSILSAVNAVLLRKLPYKNADRLVLLCATGGRTTTGSPDHRVIGKNRDPCQLE